MSKITVNGNERLVEYTEEELAGMEVARSKLAPKVPDVKPPPKDLKSMSPLDRLRRRRGLLPRARDGRS